MFKNITELLNKLKLVREAIKTRNLDTIGDVIEEIAKLIGWGAYGVLVDDILDAFMVKDWAKLFAAVSQLIALIGTQLPGPTPPNGFQFDAIPTFTPSEPSETPQLDTLIYNIEHLTTTSEPIPTKLPIAFYIMLGQAVLEIVKMWREHKKGT